MRAVSLVPSGTLLLRALGVEPVGVSHACPNPHGVPVVTESRIPKGLSQEETDRWVREAFRKGLSLYRVREEVLARLEPDLLVTQGVCEVCAVGRQEVDLAQAFLPRAPRVVELRGSRLADLYLDLEALAQAARREEEAGGLAAGVRESVTTLLTKVRSFSVSGTRD
ncbi:MAG: hypothetical protein P3W93_000240 [Thermus sp.]|nr:hypothetical protein [Thermus sp.]